MSQTIGLIEIESGGLAICDLAAPCDDATLDALFARLISGDGSDDAAGCEAEPVVLSANLEVLREELATATRHLLGEIFLSRGGRR